jgi:membrane protease YdiL (CAAX protease family)
MAIDAMIDSQNAEDKLTRFGLGLRVGVFALTGILTLQLVSVLLGWSGMLVQAAMAVFASAAVANALSLRIFERGGLSFIGVGWQRGSLRNLSLGLLGGIGSALAVTGLPVLVGMAHVSPDPERPFHLSSFLFVLIVMVFGAIGEELLFHGYAFQLLIRKLGAFQTLLPVGVLFAVAHANNLAADWLSGFNTFLWGAFLGLCFLRSGDLWLAIGVHLGWNWALPLLGANVSGFRMGTTGLVLNWHVGPLWSGGDYGPEGGLLTTLVLPVLGWCLYKAPVLTTRPSLFESASVEE